LRRPRPQQDDDLATGTILSPHLKSAPKPSAAPESFDAKAIDSLNKAGADKGISSAINGGRG